MLTIFPALILSPLEKYVVAASFAVNRNWGIYGSPSTNQVAVLEPSDKVGVQTLTPFSTEGDFIGKPLTLPIGDIVGITKNGSYVVQPYVSTPASPGDADFNEGPVHITLIVSGSTRLEFNVRIKEYIATGPFGIRKFPDWWARHAAVALAPSPPRIAIFDRKHKNRLIVREVDSKKKRLTNLEIPPAIRFQIPEIHFGANQRLYYFADESSVRLQPQGIPLLRNRIKGVDETYYVRYLVSADVLSGSCQALARVEVAGDSPTASVAADGSPKFKGNDIVALPNHIVVRANDKIFILSQRG